jgi:hypothetical protein
MHLLNKFIIRFFKLQGPDLINSFVIIPGPGDFLFFRDCIAISISVISISSELASNG